MEKLIIIGAGGHAKVIADILLTNNEYDIVGLIDDDDTKSFMGLEVVGDDNYMSTLYKQGVRKAFIAIGSNVIRKRISQSIKNLGFDLINVISSNAYISSRAIIGDGVAIMPGVVINACAKIEDGCIINTNSSIDHDTRIKQYTHIAPGSAIAGSSLIGESCFIGTGCRVIDQIEIGDNVTIGAGGVVICNIKSNSLAVGIPAKIKNERYRV